MAANKYSERRMNRNDMFGVVDFRNGEANWKDYGEEMGFYSKDFWLSKKKKNWDFASRDFGLVKKKKKLGFIEEFGIFWLGFRLGISEINWKFWGFLAVKKEEDLRFCF